MQRVTRLAPAVAAVAIAVAAPAAQAADTRPPTVPTDVRPGEVTPTTVQLRFGESTDNVRVNGYRVRGGPRVEYAGGGYAFLQLLEPGATYRFTVSAFDAAGNESAPSAPVTVTLPHWQPPANVRLTGQSRGTASLAWERPGNMPLAATYLVYVDDRLETVSWATAAQVRHLAPGSHRITVKASDWSRQVTPASAPLTISVDAGTDRVPPTAPTGLVNVFDEVTCLFDVSWDAARDDVDDPPAIVYDLLVTDYITGDPYVLTYGVPGTAVSQYPAEVIGVRAVDSAGNASPVSEVQP